MKVLLDTHALLWWLNDDERLQHRAREVIADPGNDVLVSTVSLWEIVVKIRVGKLKADIGNITDAMDRQGFVLLSISPAHLVSLVSLTFHADHRDPFDHLLITQAISEGATFLSEDPHTPRYPVRHLTCSDPALPPN